MLATTKFSVPLAYRQHGETSDMDSGSLNNDVVDGESGGGLRTSDIDARINVVFPVKAEGERANV